MMYPELARHSAKGLPYTSVHNSMAIDTGDLDSLVLAGLPCWIDVLSYHLVRSRHEFKNKALTPAADPGRILDI